MSNQSNRLWACVLLTMLALVTGGCDVFQPAPPNSPGGQPNDPPTDSLPTVNIDGTWRHEASGGIIATCLTIQNARITSIDDLCDGTLLTLLASPQAQANASGISLFAGFGASPTDNINGGLYTYMVVLQANGTLQGTVILRIEPGGPITTAPVTLVRQ